MDNDCGLTVVPFFSLLIVLMGMVVFFVNIYIYYFSLFLIFFAAVVSLAVVDRWVYLYFG